MFYRLLAGILMTGVLATAPVTAHHSAAQFDFQNIVAIAGVIVEVRVVNPHLHLVLRVTDDRGTRNITYEGHSRNNLYRRGWRPGMLNAGDPINITIAARRDGGDGGYVASVKTADGVGF